MSKPKRMDQIKAIIETYLSTKSIKSTARRLQVSKNTVKTYVNRGSVKYPNLADTLSLSDSDFIQLFQPSQPKALSER